MVSVGPRVAPPVPEKYTVLSRLEQRIAQAMSNAVFPPGGALTPSGEDLGVSRFFDGYLKELPRGMRIGLRAFLLAFELLPFFFIFKLKRFSKLTEADKERYFDAWQYHRIFWFRAAIMAVKSICCFCYFADNTVREQIGFYVVCIDGKRRQDI